MRILLVGLLLVSGASAQLLSDPSDDLHHEVMGVEATPVDTPHLDLVGFDVLESTNEFTFVLERAAPEPDVAPFDAYSFRVHLNHSQQAYMMQYNHNALLPGSSYLVLLYRIGENSAVVDVVEPDVDGALLTWTFNRNLFLDEHGAPPSSGTSLTNIWGETRSRATVVGIGSVSVVPWARSDRMPDEGSAQFEVTTGLTSRGAKLGSAEPFRASNGEAGRFYVNMSLESEWDDQTFQITVADVPPNWQVRTSRQSVQLDAGQSVSFLVELEVPFAHSHGAVQPLRVVATSQQAVARADIGIHYVDPPQPSGHHPRVWLHAASPEFISPLPVQRGELRLPYVNTWQDDPGDMGGTIEPNGSGVTSLSSIQPAGYSVTWSIPLAPDLRMGLNVTGGQTPFEITIDTPRPHPEALLKGSLFARAADEWIEIGRLSAPAQDMGMGQTTFEGTIQGFAGEVEYEPGAALRIRLDLETGSPPATIITTAPHLVSGGWFDLPLAEYRESIADGAGFAQPQIRADDVDASFGPEIVGPTKDAPAPWAPLALLVAVALARRPTP